MGLWVSRGLFAWPEDTSRMTKCPIYYMVGLILIPIQPLTRATVTFQDGADRAQVRPFSRNPWLGIYFLAWADSQIADLTLPSPHSAPPAFLPGPCWHSTSNASTLGSNAIHYLLSKLIFFGSLLTSFSTSLSGSTDYLPAPQSFLYFS